MASSSTQVEAEVNKQEEETIKELPVREEKAATLKDEDEEVLVREEEEKLYEDELESEVKEENDESPLHIVDEEAEPDHAATFDEEIDVEDEFGQHED